eukprot:Lithocolla_globosa_v1_NODE_270_length_4733_cov_5.457265.p3 type:complete len:132 gc:universal NODE_270_length_4733_cov_5.457265:930-1325(+)
MAGIFHTATMTIISSGMAIAQAVTTDGSPDTQEIVLGKKEAKSVNVHDENQMKCNLNFTITINTQNQRFCLLAAGCFTVGLVTGAGEFGLRTSSVNKLKMAPVIWVYTSLATVATGRGGGCCGRIRSFKYP